MHKDIIRVLGFDFGMKYIGVASGQSITHTEQPVGCLRAVDGIPNWDEVVALVAEWQPTILIVGNPLNMDDTEQQITFCARKFANRLNQKFKLKVEMVDERLSTWEAKQQMLQTPGKLSNKQLTQLNADSAAILVRQWLNDLPTDSAV